MFEWLRIEILLQMGFGRARSNHLGSKTGTGTMSIFRLNLQSVAKSDIDFLETQDITPLETQDMDLVETQDVTLVKTQDIALLETQIIAHVEAKDIVLVETQDIALLETKSWLHLFVQKPQEFVACAIAEMLLVWRKEKNPNHLSTWKRSMKVLTGRGSTDPLPVKKFPRIFVTGRRTNPKSHLGCRSFSMICCFSFSRLGKSWEISEPGEGQLTLSR